MPAIAESESSWHCRSCSVGRHARLNHYPRTSGRAALPVSSRSSFRDEVEVIVAFKGPLDADASKVRDARPDIRWLHGTRARGFQLNQGAACASGRWLWFVHADSVLPLDWYAAFREVDAIDRVVGGSFAFRLDSAAWQARVLERGVRWRVRWLGLPYGDQGLFVRRSVFDEMGGFADLPLMEDVDFVRRLKPYGVLRHLTVGLTTSARRWEREGWWTRSARNLLLLGLYELGAPPGWLARRYYRT